MKFHNKIKVKCLDCDIIFEADDEHHHLDYCPKCKKNAIDYETYCTRLIGNVKILNEKESRKDNQRS